MLNENQGALISADSFDPWRVTEQLDADPWRVIEQLDVDLWMGIEQLDVDLWRGIEQLDVDLWRVIEQLDVDLWREIDFLDADLSNKQEHEGLDESVNEYTLPLTRLDTHDLKNKFTIRVSIEMFVERNS